MIVKYSPAFLYLLKKANVRIRKNLKEVITLFVQDPYNLQLNNHVLRREWEGFRSINVTADWRAIFREIVIEDEEPTAYFVALGTHRQLYKTH